MSATIPSSVPAKVRAGETLQFTVALADYPAGDGWSISYYFIANGLTPFNFSSTADGDSHAVSVAYGTTANWAPGLYSGIGFVTDGTTRTEVWTGTLEVLFNPLTASKTTDPRSHARRTLDNINAVIEGRATSAVLNSTVEGTTLARIPHADLLDLQARYEMKVAAEEAVLARALGKPSRRNIYSRFTRP